MGKRRRVLPLIVLCLCTFALYGQQSWQGNAAVARSGEFAVPGLVAASNAFPENTTILVENVQTGQIVRVTVTQRIQGTASVFMLLSEEAGKQIGLIGSQVIRVRASVLSTLGTELGESLQEQAYSSDPDLNPPLSVAEEQLMSRPEAQETAMAEEPTVEIAQAAQPVEEPAAEAVEPEAEPVAEGAEEAKVPPAAEEEEPAEEVTEEVAEATAAEEQPAEPAEPAAAEATGEEEAAAEPAVAAEITAEQQPAEQKPSEKPAAKEPTPEEKRLQEVADRIPQKQLYMPPRQQEVYALAPEPAAIEEAEEIAAEEQPAEEVAEVEEEPPAEEKPEEVAEIEEEIEEVAEAEVSEVEPEEAIEAVEEGPPRVSMVGPEAEEEPLEVALPGPEATEPEKPSPEGTRLPAPEEETPLTMAPEEPPTGEIEEAAVAEQVAEQPVEEVAVAEEEPVEEVVEEVAEAVEPVIEEEPVAELAMAETEPEETTVLSEMLPSRTYFVQLGAYSTRILAEKLAGDLTQIYSVTILPASSGGRRFYKVLVGPLNEDESGTLLYQFRSRGFKDAFIQYVE